MRKLRIAALIFVFCLPAGMVARAQDAVQSGAPVPPLKSSLLDLKPDSNGKLSQEQMQRLFRVVADKDIENDKRLRDYAYVELDEERRLDGKQQVKSTEAKTFEVMELYGEQVQRLIEKDGKPLGAKEAAKEEEKIQKVIDKRKEESEDARRKREEREEKDREDSRQFVREVADAFSFRLIGEESLGGRKAWVIDADPRPGYVPRTKEAKVLPKVRGRLWVDKNDDQLAKMDIECLDTISFGFFLARVHEGSRVVFEQTRINDEVWLPKHVAVKVDVRLALLKNIDVEMEQAFSDYKKFRATAKIIGIGEVKSQ